MNTPAHACQRTRAHTACTHCSDVHIHPLVLTLLVEGDHSLGDGLADGCMCALHEHGSGEVGALGPVVFAWACNQWQANQTPTHTATENKAGCFRDWHKETHTVDLRDVATTLDAQADVQVLQALTPDDEHRLKGLVR
eukprot:scaffold140491_cov21-Tisochrysis_lutea.AAC.3